MRIAARFRESTFESTLGTVLSAESQDDSPTIAQFCNCQKRGVSWRVTLNRICAFLLPLTNKSEGNARSMRPRLVIAISWREIPFASLAKCWPDGLLTN